MAKSKECGELFRSKECGVFFVGFPEDFHDISGISKLHHLFCLKYIGDSTSGGYLHLLPHLFLVDFLIATKKTSQSSRKKKYGGFPRGPPGPPKGNKSAACTGFFFQTNDEKTNTTFSVSKLVLKL